MAKQSYFEKALSDFAFEAASGGAIRHLADLGYTVDQIAERLTFPVAYRKVQETVWKHLLDTGVLCPKEPGSAGSGEKFEYVKEYNQYGKASFRRVKLPDSGDPGPVHWKERVFSRRRDGTFADYLSQKCRENGEENAYVSCNFGGTSKKGTAAPLHVLDNTQREYIQGLPWPDGTIYHRLNLRMREITVRLYEYGSCHGTCYFLKTGEKLYWDNTGNGTA